MLLNPIVTYDSSEACLLNRTGPLLQPVPGSRGAAGPDPPSGRRLRSHLSGRQVCTRAVSSRQPSSQHRRQHRATVRTVLILVDQTRRGRTGHCPCTPTRTPPHRSARSPRCVHFAIFTVSRETTPADRTTLVHVVTSVILKYVYSDGAEVARRIRTPNRNHVGLPQLCEGATCALSHLPPTVRPILCCGSPWQQHP